MKLAQLIKTVAPLLADAPGIDPGSAGADLDICALYYRAQDVEPGGLFVAVKGFAADGHDYIEQALSRGAVAVVCERPVATDAATIVVTDSRKALADLSAEFFGHPSRDMTVIGITGTNGKTTTSYIIESILKARGFAAGVIGTINYRYADKEFDNPVTTPESLDLQRILADMRSAGTTHVVMEISSHALALQRARSCRIDVAVFTNLSQDHLDFHRDMDHYWESKKRLFTQLLPATPGRTDSRAVINIDDPKGAELAGTLQLPHITTSQTQPARVRAQEARFGLHGVSAKIETPGGNLVVHSPLAGHHNLENILNAVGVAAALGIAPDVIQSGLEALENVPGRLERVGSADQSRFVYVDYAHTPDALENALRALRALTEDRIICIFGCGGDRDKTKRPLMGAIAGRLSDLAVITSDNPRTESPGQIIEQIIAGIRKVRNRRYTPMALKEGYGDQGYVVETDRRRAIRMSIRISRPGDTILIAGKGHEPYQIIGTEKFPFDDRVIAREALETL